MNKRQTRWIAAPLAILLCGAQLAEAWSNRGHRLANLVAAQSLPSDVPAFLRSSGGISEIAYLGPEPDRWRPETEPELSNVEGPNHVFRTELGSLVNPLPRRRTEFAMRLEAMRNGGDKNPKLRPEAIGTLPWQVEEVYERLQSAFRSYRIAKGEMKPWPDEAPITKQDLPQIEASARFYAGWMGHYVADASMPLHDTVNIAGWVVKPNPEHFTENPGIHHRLEQAADDAIAEGKLTDAKIRALEPAPRAINDPFAEMVAFAYAEAKYAPEAYRLEAQGKLGTQPSAAMNDFIAHRIAEGSGMLRDFIQSAWIHSAALRTPATAKAVAVPTGE